VDALGLGKAIVAVDVTSEYPAYVKQLPLVSKNRSVSAEGILAFKPDLVLAPADDLPFAVQEQLKRLGIRLVLIRQEYSTKGALHFIRQVAAAVGQPQRGEQLAQQVSKALEAALAEVKAKPIPSPRVMFIYARGAGTMSVAGAGSSVDALIKLSGGRNVIQEFNDFKTYTTEGMVKANPDVILLFDTGLSSLGGISAFLNMPGLGLTKAGKNKRVISMDGSLLVNFCTRLPKAILALHTALMK